MKKISQLLIIFLFILVLYGCDSAKSRSQVESTSAPSVYVPEELPFEFPVPDGYTLESKSTSAVSILKGDQVVGGIQVTGLHDVCLQDTNCTHLREYLRNFAPQPLLLEYLSTVFDGKAYISVTITDRETNESQHQSHHIFEKDTIYFDLWVDTNLINDEERSLLIDTITAY